MILIGCVLNLTCPQYPDARMIQRMYQMHPSPLSDVRDTLADGELGV